MNIQDWVDDMQVEVPSCLENTMQRAVSFAIQRFFEESEAWVLKESVNVEPLNRYYALGLPPETYVYASRRARIRYEQRKYPLTSVSPADMPEYENGDTSLFCVEDGVLQLDSVRVPAVCDVEVTLKPTHQITDVPDELAVKYFQAVRSGALSTLKRMVDKDWTDKAGASDHEELFRAGVAKARRESTKVRSKVRRKARFNRGFAW